MTSEELSKEMYDALKTVNEIIAKGSSHGFNPHEGDWADKLFSSQQATHKAIKAYEDSLK